MKYISLFTGAGGLEALGSRPEILCEMDEACWPVLDRRFPGVAIHPDVTTLDPPSVDVVVGGWPCQDISVAGLRRGLAGKRSGLFFELLRVAEHSGAHTVVAENVPNLLSMERGGVFEGILAAFAASGYRYVAWRVLNSRWFGLPHERRRVFIVASKDEAIPRALHRDVPTNGAGHITSVDPDVAGFYWTAGLQSICYSQGFVPTLKVGSSLSIPSPPALHFNGTVRKATPVECLKFQGFDPADFVDLRPADTYRIAGNAVSVPVGEFVMESIDGLATPSTAGPNGMFAVTESGLYRDGTVYAISHRAHAKSTALARFVDLQDRAPFSPRAAAGLLTRLVRSGKPCPPALLSDLQRIAGTATAGIASTTVLPKPDKTTVRVGPLEAVLPGLS